MAKICFLVGHGKSDSGGYDSGAVSKNNQYHEYKIVKEIAKYAQQYYNANYAEKCDLMNYDGTLNLRERISRLKDNTYDYIAEIHLNAGGGTGPEVYYHNASPKGKNYATAISANIAAALGLRNRGAKIKLTSDGRNYFGIIRETTPTANLIECVFIDTDNDLQKVITAQGQKKCGEMIAKAVASVRGKEIEKDVPTVVDRPQSTVYFKRYTQNGVSIVDALKYVGEKSDFSYRKTIASKNSISNYRGTPEQNTKMLNLLKQGKLIKP